MGEKEFLIKQWKKRGITNPQLLKAFRDVDREHFIHEHQHSETYGDYPLPIGHGQTISQPTTIMMMINELDIQPHEKVLEIGAGSGYNAALISRMCSHVTALEIIPELTNFAKTNLDNAGIENVSVINTDGSTGYEKNAPYDKIIVTAAAPELPAPLLDQLKEGGKIIGPVGKHTQKMVVGRKLKKEFDFHSIGDFVFVPLKGKHGF